MKCSTPVRKGGPWIRGASSSTTPSSRAAWTWRPGLNRLLAALDQRRPPFEVLVVAELSRIGRDTGRAPAVRRIEEGGAEILGHLAGQRIGQGIGQRISVEDEPGGRSSSNCGATSRTGASGLGSLARRFANQRLRFGCRSNVPAHCPGPWAARVVALIRHAPRRRGPYGRLVGQARWVTCR